MNITTQGVLKQFLNWFCRGYRTITELISGLSEYLHILHSIDNY